MSLQEVEGLSSQEFKASVLGAYERGERAVSVPRLWRLARFYGLQTTELLPPDEPLEVCGDSTAQGISLHAEKLIEGLGFSVVQAEALIRFLSTIATALEAELGPFPDGSDRDHR